jgi:hypothetical protein
VWIDAGIGAVGELDAGLVSTGYGLHDLRTDGQGLGRDRWRIDPPDLRGQPCGGRNASAEMRRRISPRMLFQSSATRSRLAGRRLNLEGSHDDKRVLLDIPVREG